MNKLKTMRTPKQLPSKQLGLSLIELMISSVIGLIILAGAVTVFSSNNSSSSMSTGMARLQDNGRVALDIVANGIRMAGYEGCRSAAKPAPDVIANDAPLIDLPATAIWGAEVSNAGAWAPNGADIPAELDSIVGDARADTDVIYLQHASGRSTNLGVDMANAAQGSVTINNNPDQIINNDIVMISDCSSSHIFRASGIATVAAGINIGFDAANNDRGNLGAVYTGTGNMEDSALRVMRFKANAYLVRNSDRETPGDDPIFSLYELDTTTPNDPTLTELIEGVEQMKILFGERMGNGNIRYVSADNVDEMANVESVQIGILIATANYAASSNDERVYNIAGFTVGPPGSGEDLEHEGDRRLRAAFNTTVQLRNRNQL